MPTTPALAGADGYAPSRSAVPAIIAEYRLSPFETFVATLAERDDGRRVASISRLKTTPGGGARRMACFEFGEHRAQAIASLLDELLRAINRRSATP